MEGDAPRLMREEAHLQRGNVPLCLHLPERLGHIKHGAHEGCEGGKMVHGVDINEGNTLEEQLELVSFTEPSVLGELTELSVGSEAEAGPALRTRGGHLFCHAFAAGR